MPIVVRKPIEVANRLDQLGWTVENLLEVVGAMVAARNSCTENDPSSAPGWMAWKDGSRRMREIGRSNGLVKDDAEQVPSVIDYNRGLKFSVANTDDMTGIEKPYQYPQNRSKKGPALDRAVTANFGSLFDFMDEEPSKVIPLSRLKRMPGMLVSWYICTYSEGDDVRAELSCPVAVENGFFKDFHERIILIGPDGPVLPVGRKKDDDPSEEYDIPVTKKK